MAKGPFKTTQKHLTTAARFQQKKRPRQARRFRALGNRLAAVASVKTRARIKDEGRARGMTMSGPLTRGRGREPQGEAQ